MPLDGVGVLRAVLPGSWTQENNFHIPSGMDPGEHFSHFNNIIIFVLSNNKSWVDILYFSLCVEGFSPDLKRDRAYIVPEAGDLVSEAGASEYRRTS